MRPADAVFVGEDDPAMRRLLATAAGRGGHTVVPCEDGGQLLERLQLHFWTHRALPALVVSDQRMPGRTGLSILRTLRGWGWPTPFVLVTAFPDDELLAEATRHRATDVLSKPFPLSTLVRSIEQALPRRPPPGLLPCVSCGGLTPSRDGAPGCCDECEPTGERPPVVLELP